MNLVNKSLLFAAGITCFIIGGILSSYGREITANVFALIGVFSMFPIFQQMLMKKEEQ
jgi:hypothetical protein